MSGELPPRRQRVAAYAVIVRHLAGPGRELLLTRLAPHVSMPGGWTLPGGGIDHGEHPRDALRREVWEECGLHVESGRLLEVYSTHFTGARPDGLVEDFHGIGLVFEAQVLAESQDVEPNVVDVGGSTDAVRWIPLRQARSLLSSGRLSGSARLAITLLDPDG